MIDLRLFWAIHGLAGAREKFHNLVDQLVRVEHPTASRVRVVKGDMGLDTFVGQLTDPAGVDVFQVKYFPEKLGEDQRNQIRRSFKTVATTDAFKARTWTLCLPIELGVDERKWYEEWSAKQTQATGIQFNPMWDGPAIVGKLLDPRNRDIREEFFPNEHLEQLGRQLEELRRISGTIEGFRDVFVDHVPKPEPILLEPVLEAIGLRSVDQNGPDAADIRLQIRFRVTNKSAKAAHNWVVNCEYIPSISAVADWIRPIEYEQSNHVLLPKANHAFTVVLPIRVSRPLYRPFAVFWQYFVDGSLRFHAMSENHESPTQTAFLTAVNNPQDPSHISNLNMLFVNIQNAVRNKLQWHDFN